MRKLLSTNATSLAWCFATVLYASAAEAAVWPGIGISSKGALLAWIEPLLPAILRQWEQGDRLIELR
jgi:hypothetical protein